jgi:hypothetical protein
VSATRIPAHQVGWRPELRFAAEERDWGPRRLEDLLAINRFLSNAAGRPVVPLRERSVQLFGDEKRLGTLLSDPRLFGPGRLTLDLLRARRTSPPFIRRDRDDRSRDALIVENWDSFETLSAHGPPVGVVLYGAGAHITAALPSLLDNQPTALWYFGDLDLAGLLIAARANEAARTLGLGPVRPAVELYRLLLEHGTPQRAAGATRSATSIERATAWLEDGDLAVAVRLLLDWGQRLAQEQVGVELLTSHRSTAQTTVPR